MFLSFRAYVQGHDRQDHQGDPGQGRQRELLPEYDGPGDGRHHGFDRCHDRGGAGFHRGQADGIEQVGEHGGHDGGEEDQAEDVCCIRGGEYLPADIRRIADEQSTDPSAEEGVGGHGDGRVTLEHESPQDAVQAVAEGGDQAKDDCRCRGMSVPADPGHQDAAQECHQQGGCLVPCQFFFE